LCWHYIGLAAAFGLQAQGHYKGILANAVVTHGVIVNSTGSDGALLSDADYSINAPQNGVRERREGDPLLFTIRS